MSYQPTTHPPICPTHPSEEFNNFCDSPQCLIELCPSCTTEHCESHFRQGTRPKLININKVCLDKPQGSMQSPTTTIRQVGQIQNRVSKWSRRKQEDMEKIRKSKESLYGLVDSYYKDLLNKFNLPHEILDIELELTSRVTKTQDKNLHKGHYNDELKQVFGAKFEKDIGRAKDECIGKVERIDEEQATEDGPHIKVNINNMILDFIKRRLQDFVQIESDAPDISQVTTNAQKKSEAFETPFVEKRSRSKCSTDISPTSVTTVRTEIQGGDLKGSLIDLEGSTLSTKEFPKITIPKSLDFVGNDIKDPLSMGSADDALNTSFNSSVSIERILERKSTQAIGEPSKKDPLERFRQRFNSLKVKSPKDKQALESESSLNSKRPFAEGLEKDIKEPELSKFLKQESITDFSSIKPLIPIKEVSSLAEVDNEDKIFEKGGASNHDIDNVDENMSVEKSAFEQSYYHSDQYEADPSSQSQYSYNGHYGNQSYIYSQASDYLASPMSYIRDDFDASIIEQERIERRERAREQYKEDFKVSMSNYFDSRAKSKLLYYFQPRSKNLFTQYLDKMIPETSYVKFTKTPLAIDFEIPDYYGSIITPNGQIYLLGGRDPEKSVNYRELYTVNLEQAKLEPRAPMLEKRDSHAVCYHRGEIFVIGGITLEVDGTKTVLRTCEKYNIASNRWSVIADAPLPISNHCACVFKEKYIFCFGGRYKPNKLSNNVLMYNISVNTWISIKVSLNVQSNKNFGLTSQAAACQINDNQIFVFGGFNKNKTASGQSFLFSYSPQPENKLSKSIAKDALNQEHNTIGSCMVKAVNAHELDFAAPFWEKQAIVHENKVFCLQNVVAIENSRLSYSKMRRLLVFDGQKWSNLS